MILVDLSSPSSSSGFWAVTGMSTRSIHEVIVAPPLQVTGLMGASGKLKVTLLPKAISLCRKDQPEPVSPSPWSQRMTGRIVARVVATKKQKHENRQSSVLALHVLCGVRPLLWELTRIHNTQTLVCSDGGGGTGQGPPRSPGSHC